MNELTQLIASVLRVPASAVTTDTSMDNTPAWDSLAHMDLIMTLESHYNMQLTADDMVAMRSLSAIASLLQAKGVR